MAIEMLCDLRQQLGPARNQGSRPTCIAFAFSDGHAAVRQVLEPLSTEHLYYNAVQRTPGRDPNGGVNMPTCIAALRCDGQCVEGGWPYLEAVPAGEQWSPPATATPSYTRLSQTFSNSVVAIAAELDAARPVVVALLLGERFYMPGPDGAIVPGPGDADTDYHALLAVGHGRDETQTYLLVRNSWGAEWGLEGHAWVAAPYLEPRLYALARFPSEEIV